MGFNMIKEIPATHVLHDHEEMNGVLERPMEFGDERIIRLNHEPFLVFYVFNLMRFC
jgi:hypothetical protein